VEVGIVTGQGRFELPFANQPRLTNMIVGQHPNGRTALNREDRQPGLWLGGDGITTRLHMQAFVPGDVPGTAHIIDVVGTDPVAQSVYGDEYSTSSNTETVVSVMARELTADQPERYFGYQVKGDGSVWQSYVSPDGVHKGGTLNQPEDVSMAVTAFQTEIAAKFELNG
jgi:hypothetical protein